ncbi:MAG: Methyltransferase [Deltaproteobacteria bacterium]|nr:Methyltransferase [Deltaproteobacteria bacterium]
MITTADQQKRQQRDQWSAAATAWERNEVWLVEQMAPVTRWMCDAAKVGPGSKVLDLACGIGEPAMTIAARVTPGGHVTATDLSSKMVAAAQRRAGRLGLDLEIRTMDAERIEFPNASFDAVTCRFGLMFCPDPVAATMEIHRVLKPGGRFAVAVWDLPEKNPIVTAIGSVVGKLVPEMQAADPRAPGPFRLAPPGELATVLRGAGFTDVQVESMPVTVRFESPEAYWDVQSQIVAPLKAALATLPPEQVAKLREAVLEVAKAHLVEGEVQFVATPLVATGSR